MEKQDPRSLSQEGFLGLLRGPGADVLADRLMDTLGGLSPLVCREAALYAAGDVDARVEGLDPDTAAEELTVIADAFSASAKEKIEKAGGVAKVAE